MTNPLILPSTYRHTLPNKQFIDFVLVEPGSFIMGGDHKDAYSDEKPCHMVTLTDPYYLAITPTTNAQWAAVIDNVNPNSRFQGANLPVENVSWNDIMRGGQEDGPKIPFIEQKTLVDAKDSRLSDFFFTLPTEAQWEYAAKGGHFTAIKDEQIKLWQKKKITEADLYALYSGGDRIKEVGWHGSFLEEKVVKNSNGATQIVGKKGPNQLGLYDMTGNVWELCLDYWREKYPNKEQFEFTSFDKKLGTERVSRGGSLLNRPQSCRVSNRGKDNPGYRWNDVGFRLALSL